MVDKVALYDADLAMLGSHDLKYSWNDPGIVEIGHTTEVFQSKEMTSTIADGHSVVEREGENSRFAILMHELAMALEVGQIISAVQTMNKV